VSENNSKIDLYKKLLEESKKRWDSLLQSLPKVLPQTGTPISQRINTVSSPAITTSLPSPEVFRLAWDTNVNLSHWLEVLPDEDRQAKKYIILPSNGLVMPINEFEETSDDFTKMINGREGNINPLLETGTLEYPGTSTRWYWEVGNKVVFWHSSYFAESEWRYKTHFQKIIELDVWEQIWIYEKQADGTYERFVYVTQESYNTPANDTSVLNPWVGKNLTLFTCTPIWGIQWRWIVKAKYIDEALANIEEEIYFNDVDRAYKTSLYSIIRKIKKSSKSNQTKVFINIYNRIDDALDKYSNQEKTRRVLEYIQLQIAKEILNLLDWN